MQTLSTQKKIKCWRFLLAQVLEESLHGVVVGLGQLPDQLFGGLDSVLVVWILCRRQSQSQRAEGSA